MISLWLSISCDCSTGTAANPSPNVGTQQPTGQTFSVTELSLNGESEGRSIVVEATGAMHAALTAASRWGVIGEPYAVDVERQKLGRVTLSIRWESEGHGVRKRFTVRALKPAPTKRIELILASFYLENTRLAKH
jgi:hypothetical protein